MDTRTGMLCFALSILVISLVSSATNAAQLKKSISSEAPTYADRFNEFDWHISKAVGASIKNNVILSPISVKLVLAMLYEGAGGTTAKELEDVLKIEKGPAPAQRFSNILQSLQGSEDSGYELHVGMKLFIDKEAKPKKSYAAKISNLYNATIDSINFKNTAEAVAHVNSWAYSVTRGHIQNLLTAADAHHNTLMLLLNAVYFKGMWQYPFPLNNTKEGTFLTDQNVPIKVQYMNGVQTLSYYDSIELKSALLRLPYVGDKFAMYIILPDEDTTLNEVIANLTPTKVRSCLRAMMQVPVNISIPKFNFEFASSLAEVLKQVGINEIFSNKADLRNIAEGPRDPVVSNVIQKAAIEVNELGTIAAVVSAVELVNKFGMHTVIFNVSRPFLFFIEDETTNTVVFIGKVVNPVAPGKPIVSGAVPVRTLTKPLTTKTPETSQPTSTLKQEIITTTVTPNTDSGNKNNTVG
ncbi:serine protease inhibitor 2 [Halyomorpha halys]|uniref:serine protease inhibitor 2 n=1 Tax=Halyomorpha halys TaxID=286706 RepID=UPI0006D502E6